MDVGKFVYLDIEKLTQNLGNTLGKIIFVSAREDIIDGNSDVARAQNDFPEMDYFANCDLARERQSPLGLFGIERLGKFAGLRIDYSKLTDHDGERTLYERIVLQIPRMLDLGNATVPKSQIEICIMAGFDVPEVTREVDKIGGIFSYRKGDLRGAVPTNWFLRNGDFNVYEKNNFVNLNEKWSEKHPYVSAALIGAAGIGALVAGSFSGLRG